MSLLACRLLCRHHAALHVRIASTSLPVIGSDKLLRRPDLNAGHHQRRHASWLADFMEARMQMPMDSSLIFSLEQSLINFHQFSGLSWWMDVVLVTAALKLLMTLPLNVWREKQISKRTLVDLKLNRMVNEKVVELRPQVQSGLLSKHEAWITVKNATDVEKKRLIQHYNCHGGRRAISVLAEISVFLCYFFTLRNLCCVYPSSVMYASHEMTSQGTLWFCNLLQSDPLCILPAAVGLVTLANSEYHAAIRQWSGIPDSRLSLSLKYGIRVLAPCLAILCSYMPSVIPLYWLTSGSCNLLITYLMHQPRFRQSVGIVGAPQLLAESQKAVRRLK